MSVEFTGDDSLIDESTLTGGEISQVGMTIAARVKVNTSQTDVTARFMTVADQRNIEDCVSMYYTTNGDDVRVQIRVGATNFTAAIGINITNDVWHSYAVVIEDANTYSAYEDGSITVDSATITNGPVTDDIFDIQLGGRIVTAQDMEGKVADCAVWNTALTDDQAMALTGGMSPLAIQPSNLKSHVPMLHDIYQDRMQLFNIIDAGTTPTLDNSDNPAILFPE